MNPRIALFLVALSLVSVLALTTSESRDAPKNDLDRLHDDDTDEIVEVLLDDVEIYLEQLEKDEGFETVSVYAGDIETEEQSAWRRALLANVEEDCRKPKKSNTEEKCREPKKPAPPPPPKRPPPPPPDEYVYDPPYMPPNPVPLPDPSPPPPLINAPPPPPREDMCTLYTPRRKILSGPRLVPDGGLRACTGLHVSSPSACCQICQQTGACAGWMYTRPLDCRQFGYAEPQNVCYMVSEVTGSYDPVLGIEYASGTATY